jgi:hypothetical protein
MASKNSHRLFFLFTWQKFSLKGKKKKKKKKEEIHLEVLFLTSYRVGHKDLPHFQEV